MKKWIFASFAVLACLAVSAVEKSVTWQDNYAAVRKEAAEKKIPILMVFSGSDWCPPCMKLHETVFSQPEFAAFAAKGKVVLFFADLPRRKKISSQVLAQNRQLMQTYGIRGVPTVLLTDASGKVFARTGYRPGGAKKYVKHLETLLKKAPK